MKLGVNGRFYQARTTGVQRFAREIVRRLAATEEVVLFLPAAGSRAEALPDASTVVRGRSSGWVWEQLELPRRAAGVDVVLHPANTAPLTGPAGVVVLHDLLPFTHPTSFRRVYGAVARLVAARAARRARAVLTVSEWSARQIEDVLGIPRARIAVVPQAAGPLDRPASPAAIEDALRRSGLATPYFLALAGGDPRKGLDFLQRVWCGPDAPPAQLAVVGAAYGSVHPRVGPASHERIRFLGYVSDDDLRALYTGAAALLHPALAEGFGRPPLEAMACGTRVVTAPYGPAPEVVGDAGEIVPLEAAAWAAALREILAEDPVARAAAVTRGRERAAAVSWSDAAEIVARVCRECAGERP